MGLGYLSGAMDAAEESRAESITPPYLFELLLRFFLRVEMIPLP